MAKCKKCERKGLFLKVNEDGYCPNCAILIDFESKKRALEDDIAKLQEQINDKKKIFLVCLNCKIKNKN